MKLLFVSDYQLPVIACFFLFIAMIFYWICLVFPKEKKFTNIAKISVFISNLLFFTTLISRWFAENYFPLSNLYESLIFLSWGISFIHLYLEIKTKSRVIGALSTPLLLFLSGFSTFTLPIEMQKALPLVPSLQSNWLMMHVSMMMISYATLIVGSLLSILYLFFMQFTLRTQTESFSVLNTIQTINVSRNSFLEIVDIWSYRIIGLGFPFLTIGIISGAVWANEAWGSYWSWDPKETWAFITWLVFAIYLHSRLIKGWQGKNAAILGAGGFFVIWICYLGVNFLGKGLHSYGWVL